MGVALTLAQTAKQKAPNSPVTADALGWAYYKLGSVDRAIAELRESAGKAPANPLYQYHLGMAYLSARQFDLAGQALRASLRQDRNFRFAGSASAALETVARQTK